MNETLSQSGGSVLSESPKTLWDSVPSKIMQEKNSIISYATFQYKDLQNSA